MLKIDFKCLSKMALNLYSQKQYMEDVHPQYPLFACKVYTFLEFISHLGCIFRELPFIFANCLPLSKLLFLRFLHTVYTGLIFCILYEYFLPDFCLPFSSLGFPCGSAGKESACNAGDLGSILGLGRRPGERERLPATVFWPGEFHGLYSLWGHKESDTTEWLSLVSCLSLAISNKLYILRSSELQVPQGNLLTVHLQ